MHTALIKMEITSMTKYGVDIDMLLNFIHFSKTICYAYPYPFLLTMHISLFPLFIIMHNTHEKFDCNKALASTSQYFLNLFQLSRYSVRIDQYIQEQGESGDYSWGSYELFCWAPDSALSMTTSCIVYCLKQTSFNFNEESIIFFQV